VSVLGAPPSFIQFEGEMPYISFLMESFFDFFLSDTNAITSFPIEIALMTNLCCMEDLIPLCEFSSCGLMNCVLQLVIAFLALSFVSYLLERVFWIESTFLT